MWIEIHSGELGGGGEREEECEGKTFYITDFQTEHCKEEAI
jgi:hypothetical protein